MAEDKADGSDADRDQPRRGQRRRPRRSSRGGKRSSHSQRDSAQLGDEHRAQKQPRSQPQPQAPTRGWASPAHVPFYRRKTARRVFLLAVVVGVVLFGYALRDVFNPLLIALMVAYILNPVANWLEKHRIRRSLAVVAIYAAVLAPCLAGIIFVTGLVYSEAQKVPAALLGEEKYADANKSGRFDPAEPIVTKATPGAKLDPKANRYYLDLNDNGRFDPAEPVLNDANGNGKYDPGLLEKAYVMLWDGDQFDDRNSNMRYDPAETLTKDVNGNGKYDPNDGDEFEDLNNNGRFDPAEKLTKDVNGNGKYDPNDGDEFEDLNKNSQFDPGDKLRCDWDGNGRYNAGLVKKLLLLLPGRSGVAVIEGIHAGALYERVKKFMAGKWGGAAQITVGQIKWLNETFKNAMDVAFKTILVAVYAFFFLLGMNKIGKTMFEYLPGPQRETFTGILMKIHVAVSSFFRGRLMVCAILGILVGVGLALLDVRFALLLGLLTGIGDLVPFLGVIAGLCPAVLFVYLDHHSLMRVVMVIAWFSACQAAEGMIIVPLVLGKEVEMHPVTLIVSLLIGAQLFGLFGVLIAIPLTCILKILGQELVLPELRQLAHDKDWVDDEG